MAQNRPDQVMDYARLKSNDEAAQNPANQNLTGGQERADGPNTFKKMLHHGRALIPKGHKRKTQITPDRPVAQQQMQMQTANVAFLGHLGPQSHIANTSFLGHLRQDGVTMMRNNAPRLYPAPMQAPQSNVPFYSGLGPVQAPPANVTFLSEIEAPLDFRESDPFLENTRTYGQINQGAETLNGRRSESIQTPHDLNSSLDSSLAGPNRYWLANGDSANIAFLESLITGGSDQPQSDEAILGARSVSRLDSNHTEQSPFDQSLDEFSAVTLSNNTSYTPIQNYEMYDQQKAAMKIECLSNLPSDDPIASWRSARSSGQTSSEAQRGEPINPTRPEGNDASIKVPEPEDSVANKRKGTDCSPTLTDFPSRKARKASEEGKREHLSRRNFSLANVQFLHRLRGRADAILHNEDQGPKAPIPSINEGIYQSAAINGSGIRLMSVERSVQEGSEQEIYCRLKSSQDWRTSVEYQCLSYCWGESKSEKVIRVGTHDTDETWVMPVTTNLYAALRNLRDSQDSSLFWIDAICINQDDQVERAAQVSMMRDIYSSAAGVIVWLGEDTPSTKPALNFIKEISSRFQSDTQIRPEDIVGPSGLHLKSNHVDKLGTYTMASLGDPYKSVAQFFSLPWFRRVWVLQEAFSHAVVTVHFGKYAMPWGSIILAALWQSRFARKNTATGEPGGIHSRNYLPDLWLGLLHTQPERGLSMLELVARARDFEASDPRDKVFALLGLANDLGESSIRRPGLRPDYSKSKAAVYRSFAKDLIAMSGRLDVLSLVDTFSEEIKSQKETSWMPDLDVSIATIRGLGFPRKYDVSFSSCIRIDILDSLQFGQGSLSLAGFSLTSVDFTTVEALNLSRELKVYTHDRIEAISHLWKTHVQGTNVGDVSEQQLLQSFIELVTATGFALPTEFPAQPLGKVVPTKEVPSVFADFAAYWARMEPDFASFEHPVRQHLQEQAENGDPDQFGVLAGKACHQRKFFRTADGRMGLCPRHAIPGDAVVILYGGSVPYLLRKTGPETWSFVGECYVDGIMFGEAERVDREEQIFNIV